MEKKIKKKFIKNTFKNTCLYLIHIIQSKIKYINVFKISNCHYTSVQRSTLIRQITVISF